MKKKTRVLLFIAAIPVSLGFAIAAFISFGPVKITSWSMLVNALTGAGIASPDAAVLTRRVTVPEGFSLSVYAVDLPMARFMVFTKAGDLLVSRPRDGEVVLLKRDSDGDGLPDGRVVILENLTRPHGLALHEGWLYIAESNAVGRIGFDVRQGESRGEYQKIIRDLPNSGNHWSKSIGFGPDGMLYLSIGSTCNVCVEEDPRRATMMRYKADGTGGEIYATGLRNTVGFDWAPWNDELYGTDNGRDLMGDDFPPCELNHIQQDGFYGWPYINGFGDLDPDLGEGQQAMLDTAISPVFGFAAHNAPLGMSFVDPAGGFPERSALVALHGSWNRSIADGYKVVLLQWQQDGSIQAQDFLSGFEQDGDIIGRPVDVVQGADGDIYVSDDYAGVIYRITHGSGGYPQAHSSQPGESPARESLPLAGIDAAELPQLVQRGSALYQHHQCASCHAGQGSAGRLDKLADKYDWQGVMAMLETPTPPMPRFELSAEEQQAIAVYLLAQ